MDQVDAADVAKECLLAAVKADPKVAHLWSNLANAYFLMGDYRNACKCLEKVVFITCYMPYFLLLSGDAQIMDFLRIEVPLASFFHVCYIF